MILATKNEPRGADGRPGAAGMNRESNYLNNNSFSFENQISPEPKAHMDATLEWLHPDGDKVFEVRIINPVIATGPWEGRAFGGQGKKIVAGWFRDRPKAVELVSQVKAEGIYVTLNPVNPALGARAHERLKPNPAATSDKDVVGRHNLLFDFDPVRPSGVSSSEQEHEVAILIARQVKAELAQEGWPEPLLGDSGNGAHLLYAIELENTPESTELLKSVLGGLAQRYAERLKECGLEVDQMVFNASRISKLYGTRTGKGDNLPERPHRYAKILEMPAIRKLVPLELLQRLAAEAPSSSGGGTNGNSTAGHGDTGTFDLAAYLKHFEVEVVKVKPHAGGHLYCLQECLFDSSHSPNEAAIYQAADGTLSYKCFHSSCKNRTWAEARQRISGDEKLTRFIAGGDRAAGGTRAEWPEPGLIPECQSPAVLRLPMELVPALLAPWVQDVSERMCVPPELVAVPMLVSLGALVGRKVGIYPKRHDDWLEIPNFWGAEIMRPGMLKTPAIAEATKPLRDLAREAREKYEDAAKDADRRATIIEAKIDRLKATMRNPNKCDDIELYDMGRALAELKEELKAVKVTERRYYTQDSTVEKLGELLKENPHGLLVLRDELAGWLRTLDKPGREGDREFYLEAWDGKKDYTVDRIKRGTIHIPCHTISIFGGIQPGKLRSYIAGAIDQEGSGADGLLQRFQFLVWPDDAPLWVKHDRAPNIEARERVSKIIKALNKLAPEDLGLPSASPGTIPAIRFDEDAQGVFDEWRDRLERRLRSDEMSDRPAFESHLAKYRSLMPTLALLFFLIDWAAGEVSTPRVGVEHASRAAAWCDYLESHAAKVYAVEGPENAAQTLADRILEGKIVDGKSFRDIYRHHWGGLDNPPKLRAAAEVLENAGWVRIEDVDLHAIGRPLSPVLRINPRLGVSHG